MKQIWQFPPLKTHTDTHSYLRNLTITFSLSYPCVLKLLLVVKSERRTKAQSSIEPRREAQGEAGAFLKQEHLD